MNDLINRIPEFLRNEFAFFALLAVGVALVGYVLLWMFREIRGQPSPPPTEPAAARRLAIRRPGRRLRGTDPNAGP